MAMLSKERDSLQNAIKTYKSLFETTEQLIEELQSKQTKFCFSLTQKVSQNVQC